MVKIYQSLKTKRRQRIKAKIKGTPERPRISVFRSSKHIYVELIDDTKGKTLASASDLLEKSKIKKGEKAKIVGKAIAQKALALKIKRLTFDRGSYKYHGRIKDLAEEIRKEGLIF